jgi:hypothetical protein
MPTVSKNAPTVAVTTATIVSIPRPPLRSAARILSPETLLYLCPKFQPERDINLEKFGRLFPDEYQWI